MNNKRIIVDIYIKDLTEAENIYKEWGTSGKKAIAINNMYAWLYERRFLQEASFRFKDYENATEFALDVNILNKYKDIMLNSGIPDANLAVEHIFNVEYSPCIYSGAIQLTFPMISYRDKNGVISKTWECSLAKTLDNKTVNNIYNILKEQGVKEAIKTMFDEIVWLPDLNEENVATYRVELNDGSFIEGTIEVKNIKDNPIFHIDTSEAFGDIIVVDYKDVKSFTKI